MTSKLHSVVERILKPAVFLYDFTSPRTRVSYYASRVWILLWLLIDASTQFILESGSASETQDWLSLGIWFGTVSTFILMWKLPPILGATLAGTGLFRAAVSLGTVYCGYAYGALEFASVALLVIQGWMLVAYGVLILRYVRTPKKDMPAVVWPAGMVGSGGIIVRRWWA